MPTDLPGVHRRVVELAGRFGIPGLAIAAVTPDTGPITLCHGTDASGTTPIDAHTPFSVASSGKHATAVAVLALARSGRIDLDDAIGDHLDDLPVSWRSRRIVELLHHTSGLPDYLADAGPEPVPPARTAFLARYRHLEPWFDAGAAWCYSNTNYILLGFLVARKTGLSYPRALRRLVFEPGACVEVAAGGPDIPTVSEGADVYAAIESEATAREVAGDGDLVLSATGALSWERMLAGDTVLDTAAGDAMVEPMSLSNGRRVPYGCGWFVDRVGTHACHHHAGHFGVSTAFIYRMPSAGAAVYLMSNVALGHTRYQRYLAQLALEMIAPGCTPLGLEPAADAEAALTQATRRALIRRDGPADPAMLAPELRILVERVAGGRSMLNLWSGEEPVFTFIDERVEDGQRLRRYRLAYDTRVEHVLVGHTPDDRLFWAWPS